MTFDGSTSLSRVTDLFSKNCFYRGSKSASDQDIPESFPNHVYELDEETLEEVFADHVLMSKRLQKSLYAGKFNDFEELPDHPPLALTGLALELFSKAAPNYGLDILDMDYVSSSTEAARISPCAMIVAMIYLERLQLKNSDYLENVSPSGLFVVTMLIASKFLFENDVDIVTNQIWSEYLNLDVKDLNSLEHEFLDAIEWKVFVDSSDYFRQLCEVEKIIALRQSSMRGWLSYSDINAVMQDMLFQASWSLCFKLIAKVTLLSTLGYIASALALFGSGVALQKFIERTKCTTDASMPNNAFEHSLPVDTNVNFILADQNISDSSFCNTELCSVKLPVKLVKVDLLQKKLISNAFKPFSECKTDLPVFWLIAKAYSEHNYFQRNILADSHTYRYLTILNDVRQLGVKKYACAFQY